MSISVEEDSEGERCPWLDSNQWCCSSWSTSHHLSYKRCPNQSFVFHSLFSALQVQCSLRQTQSRSQRHTLNIPVLDDVHRIETVRREILSSSCLFHLLCTCLICLSYFTSPSLYLSFSLSSERQMYPGFISFSFAAVTSHLSRLLCCIQIVFYKLTLVTGKTKMRLGACN